MTLELNPLPDGLSVRLFLKVDGGLVHVRFTQDLRATMVYEQVQEHVNNALRKICAEIEPRCRRLRMEAQRLSEVQSNQQLGEQIETLSHTTQQTDETVGRRHSDGSGDGDDSGPDRSVD